MTGAGNSADALARKIADTLRAQEGTGAAWGIEIEEVREGYARIAMRVRADMLNGHRIAHGGMMFALADTAFAIACNEDESVTVAAGADITFTGVANKIFTGTGLTTDIRQITMNKGTSSAGTMASRGSGSSPASNVRKRAHLLQWTSRRRPSAIRSRTRTGYGCLARSKGIYGLAKTKRGRT